MTRMECPFCGTRLPIVSTQCWYCYKSLMLYFPTLEHRTPEPAGPVRRGPVAGHAMRIVLAVVLTSAVALFFLLAAR